MWSSKIKSKPTMKNGYARKVPFEVVNETEEFSIGKKQTVPRVKSGRRYFYQYCKIGGMPPKGTAGLTTDTIDKKITFYNLSKRLIDFKRIDLTSILPKHHLDNKDKFLLVGEFLVHTYQDRNKRAIPRIAPNKRFAILTRQNLVVFRSKESCVEHLNPLDVISLFNIVSCNVLTKQQASCLLGISAQSSTLKTYSLYLCYGDLHGGLIPNEENNQRVYTSNGDATKIKSK